MENDNVFLIKKKGVRSGYKILRLFDANLVITQPTHKDTNSRKAK